MSAENPELKHLTEAALFAANTPLTIDKIISLFPDDARPSRDEVRGALTALAEDYAARGVELKQVDNAFRFQTREPYAPLLRKLWEGRPPRYSRALLETLAIIAYRQPVTRGDIEEIRGVTVSSETVRTLLAREWVRQVGHRDIPGKPALYGTTRGFLEHFNLKSLSELPSLSELRDTEVIAEELNMRLDLDEPEAAAENPEEEPDPVDAGPEGDDHNEAIVDEGDADPARG